MALTNSGGAFVAWNCCERFDRNYLHLRDLDFDVDVVCECGPLIPDSTTPARSPRSSSSPSISPATPSTSGCWHVSLASRRVAPRRGSTLAPARQSHRPSRLHHPRCLGSRSGMGRGPALLRDATGRVVAQTLPAIDGPVVLAADLNAPILSSTTSTRLHTDSVDRLLAGGLVSAFTAARGEADPLAEPTYFHRWNPAQPFHIDHVFLPKEWISGMSSASERTRSGLRPSGRITCRSS